MTGRESEIPSTIKTEVIEIIRELNHLPMTDIEFTKEMVHKLALSVNK